MWGQQDIIKTRFALMITLKKCWTRSQPFSLWVETSVDQQALSSLGSHLHRKLKSMEESSRRNGIWLPKVVEPAKVSYCLISPLRRNVPTVAAKTGWDVEQMDSHITINATAAPRTSSLLCL